ncbi:antitoxin, partial [Pseudomonas sp. FSL R10-0071]|nr:antitoxin [Pseudomonas sp. FSL R10-0071]
MQSVLADRAVSVSELKKNPSAVMNAAHGAPVAVLN